MASMALRMLVLFGGRERSSAELVDGYIAMRYRM